MEKKQIQQIYEGWKNKLTPSEQLKEAIKLVSQSRKVICDGCEWNSVNRKKTHGYKSWKPYDHCVDCGCQLDAKQKCLSCECPLKKWTAVISQEQNNELKQELDGENKESSS